MTDCILALDLGTTNIKCILFNLRAEIIGSSSAPVETLHPGPGQLEQSPEAIYQSTIHCINQLQISSVNILSVVISGAMHSLLAVDDQGKPLTNAWLWSDLRSAEIASELKGTEVGMKMHLETGTPVHPMSPLCKLLWIKSNSKELYERGSKFISLKEFLIYQLTGEYLIDQSLASATGLMSLQTKVWSKTALDLSGLSPDRFSEIKKSGHSLPIINGSLKGVPLILGAGDGCLANLGGGVLDRRQAALTIGTSAALRTTTDKAKVNSDLRSFCYYLDDDLYIIGGATNNGGNIIPWLKEKFKVSESEMAQIPPGSLGVTTLPYVYGERAPFWQTGMNRHIEDRSGQQNPAAIARSFIEGISFNLKLIGESIGSFDQIIASGGFTQSTFWPQMIADVFDKPVSILHTTENTALGAAFLAMKSLGVIESYEEVRQFIEVGQTYEPDSASHGAYMESFAVFCDLLKERGLIE